LSMTLGSFSGETYLMERDYLGSYKILPHSAFIIARIRLRWRWWWRYLYSSQQSMDPSLRIFASKPGITFNLLLLATIVSALNSSKYLGTQSDVLLTCSVRAITLVLFFHRVL
jgi:hypothetical protein